MNKLLMIIPITFFYGCGNIFMPYNEDFSCNKGVGAGTCASMSDNYKAIEEKHDKKIIITSSSENKSGSDNTVGNCQKCSDLEETIWVRQRALEKEAEQKRRGY